MTVYVVQSVTGLNYSDLSRFGDVLFVAQRHCYPDEADAHAQKIVDLCRAAFASFNPDTDFVALSGDPINIAVISGWVLARFKVAKFLKFDRKNNGYYPVKISII